MLEFSFLFLINLFFYYYFESIVSILNCYDYPNKIRRIHKKKIAKVGGFLILVNIILFYAISFNSTGILKQEIFFIIGCIVFFFIGFFL